MKCCEGTPCSLHSGSHGAPLDTFGEISNKYFPFHRPVWTAVAHSTVVEHLTHHNCNKIEGLNTTSGTERHKMAAKVIVVYIGSLTAGWKSTAPGENLQPSKFLMFILI